MVIGVIGRGPWGKNIERVLRSERRVDEVLVRGRGWHDLLEETRVSGVVIACPPEFHAEVARPFLERGTPVFIEKPLTLSRADAEPLVELATLRPTTPVLVDHVGLFSELYEPIRARVHEAIAAGEKIHYLSIGWSGEKKREDTPPLWDYGSHAVALALDLLGPEISFVWDSSTSVQDLNSFLVEGGPLLRPSRVYTGASETYAQRRVGVELLHGSSSRMTRLGWDDLRKQGWSDHVMASEETPPLTRAVRIFLDAIGGKPDPRIGLELGLAVVKRLEGLERAGRYKGGG